MSTILLVETAMPAISPRRHSNWLTLLPAALLFLLTIIGIIATAGLTATARGHVAVLAPPWVDFHGAATIVAAADGMIIDAGPLGNIVIATATTPHFVERLYAAGAWLVLDQDSLSGCLAPNLRTS